MLSGPRPTLWVCTACGKVADDKMGKGCHGWDVSCFMNAVEVYADLVVIENGRAVEIKDGGLLEVYV